MNKAMAESTLVIHAYNRPEMLRASVMSAIAFGRGAGRFVVQDDFSTDQRTVLWLREMSRHGLFEFMEAPWRLTIGEMYGWTAETCAEDKYVIALDGDIVLAEDALTSMCAVWEHWEKTETRLGMLCATTGRARAPKDESELVVDGDFALWSQGQFSDIALVMFLSEPFHRLREHFIPSWRRPIELYTRKLRRAGFIRRASVRPRISTLHLGKIGGDIPGSKGHRGLSLWGGPGKRELFPDLFDETEYYEDPVGVSLRFGTAFAEQYLNENERDAVASADRVSGLLK